MDDAGLTAKLEKPAPLAANGAAALAVTVGDALDRTNAMLDAGLRQWRSYWQAEALRFLDEAKADSQAAFARLQACRSPLDVLAAEHEWLRARSRSALEAGVRLVDTFAAVVQSARPDAVARPAPPRRKRATTG